MNDEEKKFKLIDSNPPPLSDGDYKVTVEQNVTSPANSTFKVEKDFCVTVNSEFLPDDAVFNLRPTPNERGDFSNELPYMVFNDPSYPWIREIKDDNGNIFPWIALIVVSEQEVVEEKDVEYRVLSKEVKEAPNKKVYFPYILNKNSPCKDDDKVHLITIKKNTFDKIMPTKEDRIWLTHSKRVDFSNVEDKISQKDGFFSVVIANRFPPCKESEIVKDVDPQNNDKNIARVNEEDKTVRIKNTVHLIAADLYDDAKSDKLTGISLNEAESVELISLYHWNIYSEKNEVFKNDEATDKSFVTLVKGLNKNGPPTEKTTLTEKALKLHILRTGEKTFSWYHSPLQPMKYNQLDINNEDKFTSDGRLIYYKSNGLFDVSYSAAFNLGKLVTLSHKTEAQEIMEWRKANMTDHHLKKLRDVKFGIGIDDSQLGVIIDKLDKGKLQ